MVKGWQVLVLAYSNITVLTGQLDHPPFLPVWDTGDPQTMALQSSIVCFLDTLYMIFHPSHCINYTKWICMKKYNKHKWFIRQFVRNTLFLKYFFTSYNFLQHASKVCGSYRSTPVGVRVNAATQIVKCHFSFMEHSL